MPEFYHLATAEVFKSLDSSSLGLSTPEAGRRLAKNGLNILSREKPYKRWRIFISQFKNPLIYILLVAAIFSYFAGEPNDAQIISAAILINVCIGYFQENKANQALRKLKLMVEHKALVLRDGKEIEIPAADITIGDILILKAGGLVLADARFFQGSELETNEASLTGESSAILKTIEPMKKGIALADRRNMVYAGTSIVSGSGLAVVTAIGKHTEIGKISELVKNANSGPTPLQERLGGVSKFLSIITVIVCLIVVAAGLINGFGLLMMFSSAAAIAVAAIPEGMSIAITVILALGMKQMVKRKALARKLLAAETLGSITVICSDKTGTLTEGVMRLEKIISKDQSLAFKIGLLCNNAILLDNKHSGIGSALEIAFLKSALEKGISREKLSDNAPRLAELPFSSETKFMLSLHQEGDNFILLEKGAGEIVLKKCSYFQEKGKVEALSEKKRLELARIYDELAASGSRAIALAYREFKKIPFNIEIEHKDWTSADEKLVFVGFAAFKDPLRKEAKSTIALCRQAGIRPIIITGDHPGTASAIASELRISADKTETVTGELLENLNDSELQHLVKTVSVFARVSPEHKIRIVKALKHNGEVVAMTGDGLNDSPALKAADIGVCLGSGTEVAKETADLVLLDDNFSVIVGAIKQGRIIFDNIRKSLTYLISDSFSEMILVLGSILSHAPLALLPAQILWINIINDGLPNFSLAFENGDETVMDRKPIKRSEPIFNAEMKMIIIGVGIACNLLLFALFYYFSKHLAEFNWSLEYLRTLFFAILIFKSLTGVFSLRSLSLPIYKIKQWRNPYLFSAVFFGLALMIFAVYNPALNRVLQIVPLNVSSWTIVLAGSLVNILMIELTKYYYSGKTK